MLRTPERDRWLEFAGLKLADFPGLTKQRRRVWFSEKFEKQLGDMENWEMDRDKFEGPKSQAQYVLQRFAEGVIRIQEDWDYKLLKSTFALPVYELRSRDVRIFGFAISPGEFCAVTAFPKSYLRPTEKYNVVIKMVNKFVEDLPIPQPKFTKERLDEIYR